MARDGGRDSLAERNHTTLTNRPTLIPTTVCSGVIPNGGERSARACNDAPLNKLDQQALNGRSFDCRERRSARSVRLPDRRVYLTAIVVVGAATQHSLPPKRTCSPCLARTPALGSHVACPSSAWLDSARK